MNWRSLLGVDLGGKLGAWKHRYKGDWREFDHLKGNKGGNKGVGSLCLHWHPNQSAGTNNDSRPLFLRKQ